GARVHRRRDRRSRQARGRACRRIDRRYRARGGHLVVPGSGACGAVSHRRSRAARPPERTFWSRMNTLDNTTPGSHTMLRIAGWVIAAVFLAVAPLVIYP